MQDLREVVLRAANGSIVKRRRIDDGREVLIWKRIGVSYEGKRYTYIGFQDGTVVFKAS